MNVISRGILYQENGLENKLIQQYIKGMNKEQLQHILNTSREKQKEKREKVKQVRKLSKEVNQTVIELNEQLLKLQQDQEFRNAQEQLPILLQIAAHSGESTVSVFKIGFRHTSGTFMKPETFNPESPRKLVGGARLFFDWLKENGYEPRIDGRREEYFDRWPAHSTGLEIVVDLE